MTLSFGGSLGYTSSFDSTYDNGRDTTYGFDANTAYTFTGAAQFVLSNKMTLNLSAEYLMTGDLEGTGTYAGRDFGSTDGFTFEAGLNVALKNNITITPFVGYNSFESDVPEYSSTYELTSMSYGVRFGAEF